MSNQSDNKYDVAEMIQEQASSFISLKQQKLLMALRGDFEQTLKTPPDAYDLEMEDFDDIRASESGSFNNSPSAKHFIELCTDAGEVEALVQAHLYTVYGFARRFFEWPASANDSIDLGAKYWRRLATFYREGLIRSEEIAKQYWFLVNDDFAHQSDLTDDGAIFVAKCLKEMGVNVGSNPYPH